jgi:hypothetical protein
MVGYSESDIDEDSDADLNQKVFRKKIHKPSRPRTLNQKSCPLPTAKSSTRQHNSDLQKQGVESLNDIASPTSISERATLTSSRTGVKKVASGKRRGSLSGLPTLTKPPHVQSNPTSKSQSKKVKRLPFHDSSSESEDYEAGVPEKSPSLSKQLPPRRLNLGRLKQMIGDQSQGTASTETSIATRKGCITAGRSIDIETSVPKAQNWNLLTTHVPVARAHKPVESSIPRKRGFVNTEHEPDSNRLHAKKLATESAHFGSQPNRGLSSPVLSTLPVSTTHTVASITEKRSRYTNVTNSSNAPAEQPNARIATSSIPSIDKSSLKSSLHKHVTTHTAGANLKAPTLKSAIEPIANKYPVINARSQKYTLSAKASTPVIAKEETLTKEISNAHLATNRYVAGAGIQQDIVSSTDKDTVKSMQNNGVQVAGKTGCGPVTIRDAVFAKRNKLPPSLRTASVRSKETTANKNHSAFDQAAQTRADVDSDDLHPPARTSTPTAPSPNSRMMSSMEVKKPSTDKPTFRTVAPTSSADTIQKPGLHMPKYVPTDHDSTEPSLHPSVRTTKLPQDPQLLRANTVTGEGPGSESQSAKAYNTQNDLRVANHPSATKILSCIPASRPASTATERSATESSGVVGEVLRTTPTAISTHKKPSTKSKPFIPEAQQPPQAYQRKQAPTSNVPRHTRVTAETMQTNSNSTISPKNAIPPALITNHTAVQDSRIPSAQNAPIATRAEVAILLETPDPVTDREINDKTTNNMNTAELDSVAQDHTTSFMAGENDGTTQVPAIPDINPLTTTSSELVPDKSQHMDILDSTKPDVSFDSMDTDSQTPSSNLTNMVSDLPVVALKDMSLSRQARENAEAYFEYTVYEKVWSDPENEAHVKISELSSRITCVDDANKQAEQRFTYVSKEEPKHKHVKFLEWKNQLNHEDCISYVGTFAHAEFPTQKQYHKIWVERHLVCKIAAAVQPPQHDILFINKTVYILRLFRLIEEPNKTGSVASDDEVSAPDTSSDSDTASSSESDVDPDKGKYKKKEQARRRAHIRPRKMESTALPTTFRQHHPVPNNEIYTTLPYANRAARRLQIEMSHEENPSRPLTAKWQESNARELEQRVNELEKMAGEDERLWKSEFNGFGPGGDRFELVVEKTTLGGPRNL